VKRCDQLSLLSLYRANTQEGSTPISVIHEPIFYDPKKHTQGKIGSQHILPDHVSGVEFQTLLIVYENSKNKRPQLQDIW